MTLKEIFFKIIRNFTLIGNMFPLLVLGAILTFLVDFEAGAKLMAVWFVGYLINLILKNTIRKPRPNSGTHRVQVKGYSFPSGHAFISLTFYFSLVRFFEIPAPYSYIIWSLPFLLGLSRLYLKVHDVYDITGGWLFSFLYFYFLSPQVVKLLETLVLPLTRSLGLG
jgi:undecaprenyl-diphosphatase